MLFFFNRIDKLLSVFTTVIWNFSLRTIKRQSMSQKTDPRKPTEVVMHSKLQIFGEKTKSYFLLHCLTPFSTVFQLYRGGQSTYPCFSRFLLTSSPHNILSKPLAAFPHNNCRNNGQRWERNESCRNDYRQSSERILVEPGIESATSCSQIRNATDWIMGLGKKRQERSWEWLVDTDPETLMNQNLFN